MLKKNQNTKQRSNRHHDLTRRRCRGFASFTAVVLVGTTAIALTAVASLTMYQAERTRNAATDAQLRQLLIAGQSYASEQLADGARQNNNLDVQLPDTLASDGASLSIERQSPPGNTAKTAIINATLHGRSVNQTLVYDAISGTWRVTEVEMP